MRACRCKGRRHSRGSFRDGSSMEVEGSFDNRVDPSVVLRRDIRKYVELLHRTYWQEGMVSLKII